LSHKQHFNFNEYFSKKTVSITMKTSTIPVPGDSKTGTNVLLMLEDWHSPVTSAAKDLGAIHVTQSRCTENHIIETSDLSQYKVFMTDKKC